VTDPDTQANQTASNDSNASKSGGALSGPFGIILSLLLLGVAGVFAYNTFYAAEPVKLDTPPIVCICAETGKTFDYKPQQSDTFPVTSPYTNKETGYRAEACYWQEDSDEPLEKPTWVLLNEDIGKAGVTECPDCGRIVVRHNPMPPGAGRGERRNPESSANDDAESATDTTGDRD